MRGSGGRKDKRTSVLVVLYTEESIPSVVSRSLDRSTLLYRIEREREAWIKSCSPWDSCERATVVVLCLHSASKNPFTVLGNVVDLATAKFITWSIYGVFHCLSKEEEKPRKGRENKGKQQQRKKSRRKRRKK